MFQLMLKQTSSGSTRTARLTRISLTLYEFNKTALQTTNEKDNFHYADAEGFSNAIAPSMEYYDIDAINHQPISDGLLRK